MTLNELGPALRAAEAQAPKAIKAVMSEAADRLDEHAKVLRLAIEQLDNATLLRVGQMDSTSRAEEISRQVRNTLIAVSCQLHEISL